MEECARSISQRQIRPVVIRIILVEIKLSQLLNLTLKVYRDLSFQQRSSVMIIARFCNEGIKLSGSESQYLMMVL